MEARGRPARLLGLDVGERWIGVAVSEGRIAVPLTIIEHTNRDADIDRIAALVAERESDAVVVGLPVSLSGEEHGQARRTRRFGEALAERLDVPVVYQDERYSSAEVEGAAGRRPSRGAPARTDDLAAAVILQSYLDSRGPDA
jgi:putative holliday junction resolvase